MWQKRADLATIVAKRVARGWIWRIFVRGELAVVAFFRRREASFCPRARVPTCHLFVSFMIRDSEKAMRGCEWDMARFQARELHRPGSLLTC